MKPLKSNAMPQTILIQYQVCMIKDTVLRSAEAKVKHASLILHPHVHEL